MPRLKLGLLALIILMIITGCVWITTGCQSTPTAPVSPIPIATRVAAPIISFEATPPWIEAGKCTALTWAVDSATTVYLDGEAVGHHGSKQMCPDAATTCTMRAVGPGGERTADITVVVIMDTPTSTPTDTPIAAPPPPPTATATPTPPPIPTPTYTPIAPPPPPPTPTPTDTPLAPPPAMCTATATPLPNVRDITAPGFINWPDAGCSPGTPNQATISATITYPSGVYGAKVVYRVVRGAAVGQWRNVGMSELRGRFVATITREALQASLDPPADYYDDGTLQYYIIALSVLGNRSQSGTGTVTIEWCVIIL